MLVLARELEIQQLILFCVRPVGFGYPQLRQDVSVWVCLPIAVFAEKTCIHFGSCPCGPRLVATSRHGATGCNEHDIPRRGFPSLRFSHPLFFSLSLSIYVYIYISIYVYIYIFFFYLSLSLSLLSLFSLSLSLFFCFSLSLSLYIYIYLSLFKKVSLFLSLSIFSHSPNETSMNYIIQNQ